MAAIESLADRMGGAAADGIADATSPLETYLVQFSRQAMACRFEVSLNAGQYAGGPEAAMAALDLLERLEDQLTVYRETSDVMAINRHASQRSVEVEPRLFELLEQAVRLCEETDGALDVTAGPLTRTWGFFDRRGHVPSEAELQVALERIGSQHVVLDAARRTVRFQRPGMEINLGAIGKGYALDRCAEQMREAGVHDFLWHGGQSSVLAAGSHAGATDGREGWRIGIVDPTRPGQRLAEVRLRDRALATSGSRVQAFREAGRRYGHVLDPRTGWPAEGVVSATVIAPTATQADGLSTAFFTLGVEATRRYCESHPEIGALLVTQAGAHRAVELHVIGLDREWVTLRADTRSA